MVSTTTTTTINTGATASGLLGLPRNVLLMLPDYLHNIEDYMNVASTCRRLKELMSKAHPHTILCLAWESTRVFFRPSPYFLICAVARQLGNWARESDENEAELVADMPRGIDHLIDLALRKKQFGLTMADIRRMHELRFSVINPVSDLVDKCVGRQWYETPNFWNGGVDDAYTIHAEADDTFFHLAIYGELFGPDFEPFLDDSLSSQRRLRVDTRLEFVKYIIFDYETMSRCVWREDGSKDPRRAVIIHPDGPYFSDENGRCRSYLDNNKALKWVMRSTRWRPHWRIARLDAGAGPDFVDSRGNGCAWRQNMLEHIMQCQGLEGLGMIRPETDLANKYKPKIREWKKKITHLREEPALVSVGPLNGTHEYPDLYGDLFICASGYPIP
ncbi:hypothetical protein F5Y06DRAFT_289138 [Hypoxylon sp. FL0890]|nr:hypothetical protein F5Y06DRAFT_289138 [Hypoxylon sp. FL0890]